MFGRIGGGGNKGNDKNTKGGDKGNSSNNNDKNSRGVEGSHESKSGERERGRTTIDINCGHDFQGQQESHSKNCPM